MTEKTFTNLDDQLDRLKVRGLRIDDDDDVTSWLQNNNYFRLSGYWRHFQINPANGNNDYHSGTHATDVMDVLDAEAALIAMILPALRDTEVLLRSRLAYALGDLFGETSYFLRDDFYDGGSVQPVVNIRDDLGRSKARFVAHYERARAESAPKFDNLPIWAAVEALSFGTLAKMLEYGKDKRPRDSIAYSLKIDRPGTLPSLFRSAVYLRNLISHHSQIWHAFMKDSAALDRAIKAQMPADDRSVFRTIQAVHVINKGAGLSVDWFADVCYLLGENPLLRNGILNPRAV